MPAQLIEHAREVLDTQGRLRALLHAICTILVDLDQRTVLERLAEAARDLLGARYAALGVLDGRGGLAQFVHVGMPAGSVAAIGRLPEGEGLLGAVIVDPRPIRLDDLAVDERSVGFPVGHPPMRSFLGVPIRVRSEVFGTLYLADADRGAFTEEDEEQAGALAVAAAIVIDNARRHEASRRRGDWLEASTAVTRRLLDPSTGAPLEVMAQHALRLADADLVAVLLPDDRRRTLRVEIAVGGRTAGTAAGDLVGRHGPVESTLCGHVLTTGRPLRLHSAHDHPGLPPVLLSEVMDVGPVLVVPLAGDDRPVGVLAVVRATGRPAFGREDLQMAAGFAGHAALALGLARARAERERLARVDDHDRIAADLHDHVIQRLYASGLALQGLTARLDPDVARRVHQTVLDLDAAIARIRTSIFDLHTGDTASESLRGQVLRLVQELAPVLGHTPLLRFTGPVDTLVETAGTGQAELVDDLLAVLREALTNTARHAYATTVEVDLTATSPAGGPPRLALVVADDGVGLAGNPRRSGLANLGRRAEQHRGELVLRRADPHGTRMEWSVPITGPG